MKIRLAASAALILASGTALAQAPAQKAPNDYSRPQTWLCRPDLTTGACTTDQSATEVAADGSIKRLPFYRRANAPVDCFYVYPTASEDETANSDMTAGREIMVTERQFGRYGQVCRQFAPLYRSITLTALRANTSGNPMAAADRELGYNDVKAAWNFYLANYNQGRGVILVGHSQGAGVLTRLIQNEIEGKPVAKQIIAAHTLGTTVQVPKGKVVGGTYKSTPLCTSATQTGCVVVYGSYRSDNPPSVTPPARFGRAATTGGTVAACTNPAKLSGGKAVLDTYQSRGEDVWAKGKTINTTFVRLPNLATGECVTKGAYTYLQITGINLGETGPRRNIITGDVGQRDPTWGLHNGDMSVAIGDLVTLADRQASAWLSKNGK